MTITVIDPRTLCNHIAICNSCGDFCFQDEETGRWTHADHICTDCFIPGEEPDTDCPNIKKHGVHTEYTTRLRAMPCTVADPQMCNDRFCHNYIDADHGECVNHPGGCGFCCAC